jgi:heme A synthase
MTRERFRTFAWATLAVTLAVILWGAYVRASGSGAGCGSHWPTCHGEIVPRAPSVATVIELTHRLTSGLSGVMVLALLVWAFAALPRRHPARAGAAVSMFFMINEGAVGAALVLLEHVALDRSVARAVWISLHLVNTFLLVAALACTAFFAGRVDPVGGHGSAGQAGGYRAALTWLGLGALGLLFTGVSGAVTALGDTLFAAPSLARGIADDFSPTAHFLQQLRVVHPVAAMLTAVFLLYARSAIAAGRGAEAERWSRILAGLLVTQLLLGMVNFALRAPVTLQLVHLLVADLVWVAFVLLGAAAFSTVSLGDGGQPGGRPRAPAEVRGSAGTSPPPSTPEGFGDPTSSDPQPFCKSR